MTYHTNPESNSYQELLIGGIHSVMDIVIENEHGNQVQIFNKALRHKTLCTMKEARMSSWEPSPQKQTPISHQKMFWCLKKINK